MSPASVQMLASRLQEAGVKVVIEGAHSAGKSTLSNHLARVLKLPHLEEPARPVLRRHNTTAAYTGKTPQEIAQIQREIMQAHLEIAHREPGAAILDRGPISVYAYTLARLSRYAEITDWLTDLQRVVIRTPSHSRAVYLLVPPNIPLAEDGVRESLPFYRQHIHYLISGMLKSYGYPHLELLGDQEQPRVQEALNKIEVMLASAQRRAEQ